MPGLVEVLETCGFAPQVAETGIVLTNCPFHDLAQAHTALICGMNLRFLDGVLDGGAPLGLTAALAPSADRCCVVLSARGVGPGCRPGVSARGD